MGVFAIILTQFASRSDGYGRYLDDNSISGILNLTRLTADGLLRSKSNGSQGLRILSMMNNTITDVLYTEASIIGISTVIKCVPESPKWLDHMVQDSIQISRRVSVFLVHK